MAVANSWFGLKPHRVGSESVDRTEAFVFASGRELEVLRGVIACILTAFVASHSTDPNMDLLLTDVDSIAVGARRK